MWQSPAAEFGVLCCLMMPGLRKDIRYQIRQLYSHQVTYYVHYYYILSSHLLSHSLNDKGKKNKVRNGQCRREVRRNVACAWWIPQTDASEPGHNEPTIQCQWHQWYWHTGWNQNRFQMKGVKKKVSEFQSHWIPFKSVYKRPCLFGSNEATEHIVRCQINANRLEKLKLGCYSKPPNLSTKCLIY